MQYHQMPLGRTKTLPFPNDYVKALLGEYSNWAYDEEEAPKLKGRWRTEAFNVPEDKPLDLEIGTGNGFFFSHRAVSNSERCLLGIEMKYKPLIQSIRRAVTSGAVNARAIRYHASFIDELFDEGELNKVFIHFPDPWEKKKQKKHRLIQKSFLDRLYKKQRPDSIVEFKTDSEDYFYHGLEKFENSDYQILGFSTDLHKSSYAESNFVTHFEQIFLRQGLPIYYLLAQKIN